MESAPKDLLNVKGDPELHAIIGEGIAFCLSHLIETLLLSLKVKKFTKFFLNHERSMIITSTHVFNLNGKSKDIGIDGLELHRKIPITKLKGITKSVQEKGGGGEFVLHVISEYDYRFRSDMYAPSFYLQVGTTLLKRLRSDTASSATRTCPSSEW